MCFSVLVVMHKNALEIMAVPGCPVPDLQYNWSLSWSGDGPVLHQTSHELKKSVCVCLSCLSVFPALCPDFLKCTLNLLQKCPDPVSLVCHHGVLIPPRAAAGLVPVAQGLHREPQGFSEKQGLVNMKAS